MGALKYDQSKLMLSLIDAPTFDAVELHTPPESMDVEHLIRKGEYIDALCAAGRLLCPTNPTRAIKRETARALTYGANKYERHNWRKGMAWSRLVDAALRHFDAYASGDVLDAESGCHHLGNLGACLMFLIVYEREGLGTDDR